MKYLIKTPKTLPVFLSCILVTASNAEPTIERVEYFIGEDPGRGNATPLIIPPGVTTLDANLEFPAGSLPTDRKVQVTVRAVDSDGTWTPPEVITIVRPFLVEDGGFSLANVEYTIGNDAPQIGIVDDGLSELTRDLTFAASTLPYNQATVAWARASRSDGLWGPPALATLLPPPVDRFAGESITGVGAWNYSILQGQSVLSAGAATSNGNELSGIDFTGLNPNIRYTLIITPVTTSRNIPLPNIGTEVDLKTDFDYWKTLHFTAAEQSNLAISGPNADPSGSGMTNLERFIVGITPSDPPRPLQMALQNSGDAGSPAPVLQFERSKLSAMTDFLVAQSTDLVAWKPAGIQSETVHDLGDGREAITIHPSPVDPSVHPSVFYRLSFSLGGP